MSRIIPLTGTDRQRLIVAALGLLRANEIHSTSNQKRVFLQNILVGPHWHEWVDDEAEMIALNTTSSRGCFPMDMVFRLDTNSVWLCIGNRGESAFDWIPFSPAPDSSSSGSGVAAFEVSYTAPSGSLLVATNVQDAIDQIVEILMTLESSSSGGGGTTDIRDVWLFF